MSPRKPSKKRKPVTASPRAIKPSLKTLVETLQLRSIVADSVSFRLNRKELGAEPRGVTFSFKQETVAAEAHEVAFRYSLDVTISKSAASRRGNAAGRPAMRITLEYTATYETKESEIDRGTVDVYGATLGSLHVLPYIRQHVADLTVRAGLPPLMMPLLLPRAPGATAE